MDARELAIYMAGAAHRDQKYGDSLYIHHLAAVDQVLEDAGVPEISSVRIAAWLHDTVEDCSVTVELIESLFGQKVAWIVHSVTNEPGANRKERAEKTYPKIARMEESLLVKLADRIANIEHSLYSDSRFALMYLKEDVAFSSALNPYYTGVEKLQYLWNRYNLAVQKIKEKYGIE